MFICLLFWEPFFPLPSKPPLPNRCRTAGLAGDFGEEAELVAEGVEEGRTGGCRLAVEMVAQTTGGSHDPFLVVFETEGMQDSFGRQHTLRLEHPFRHTGHVGQRRKQGGQERPEEGGEDG